MFKFLTRAKIKSLKKQLLNGVITQDQYFDQVFLLDQDIWFTEIPDTKRQMFILTKQYNAGTISKDEYIEKLKDVNIDEWKKHASDIDIQKHNLLQDFRNGKIIENDYNREMATLDKQPYVNVVKIVMDKTEKGNHYFELDWNQYFVDELKQNGYTGSNADDIVDQWFVALATAIASESENVIVTDPEQVRKINFKDGKSSYT